MIVVNNVAPAATLTNNGPVEKGAPVTISILATDPGADMLSYSFDWENDGIYDLLDQASSSAAHVYPDVGTYNARVRVTDDDGAASTFTTQVTINPTPARDISVIAEPRAETGTTLNTAVPATSEQPGGGDPPPKQRKPTEEVQALPYTGLDFLLFAAMAAAIIGVGLILHNVKQ